MSICVDFVNGSLIQVMMPVHECTSYLLMSPNDFNANKDSFNTGAYDVGFEGVIKMFIVGIGVGAILAILSKLRR
jgi:hypothetical protein